MAKLIAPRISSDAKAVPPLIVVGRLSQVSGLGAAARACHDALAAGNMPVYGIDITNKPKRKQIFANFEWRDGRELTGAGTVLLHVPGPLVPLVLIRLGRKFVRGKRIIAHWFWELQELPQSWSSGLSFVHEVFVNTSFVGHAVHTLSNRLPVHIVAYPLAAPAAPRDNPWRVNEVFTVLFVFNVLSNFTRKNPCAAITAFRRAFGDDEQARLIIKHANSAYWPTSIELMRQAAADARNIEFLGDMLDEAGMNELYERADVVLCLHRSEGLGLVIAEAMLRGIPVVATNWSGNTDFLTSETGIPIGYDLILVVDPQGDYVGKSLVWADPHIDEAVLALRALRADPHLRSKLGLAGAARAADFFDAARYVKRVRSLMEIANDDRVHK